MKVKAIAAAFALVAMGSNAAYAATAGDNAPFDGDGDVVFQLLNTATNQTLSWDLSTALSDLVARDFYTMGSLLSFELTNSALNAFMSSLDTASMK